MKNKVADYWGEFHTKPRPKLSWVESDVIMRNVNRRITADENMNMYQWFQNYSARRFERALIVGCGAGALERDLFRMGIFGGALGIDVAEKSIEKAKADAEEAGITDIAYRVFNLEEDDYRTLGEFDLIVVNMVAHHVHPLDSFFKMIQSMLENSDSLVLLNEYVGPNRFQHDEKTVQIVNRLLNVLNDKFKVNHLMDGKSLKTQYVLTPVQHFLDNDPSEAIRSEDVMKYFKKHFRILEEKNFGGAINHMLLTGIIENFEGSSEGESILKLLMEFEEILENFGIIQSDFVFAVGKKK
jgi:SAM-dependent methyltransferase